MRKVKLREVKWLIQNHTANRWQSQDSNPGGLTPENRETDIKSITEAVTTKKRRWETELRIMY